MATKPKNQNRPPDDDAPANDDDPAGDDDPANDDGGGGDTGGGGDIESGVEKAVRKVLGKLLGAGDLDVEDGGEGKGGKEEEPGKPRSAAAVEDDMAGKVRRVLDDIRTDEDREDRMKKLEETVFAERPPVKQRRLERLVWGSRANS